MRRGEGYRRKKGEIEEKEIWEWEEKVRNGGKGIGS